LRHRLEIAVVVRILKADLNGVVINIAYGQLGPDPGNVHGLELQVSHRAGGILREGLIDADAYFLAGDKPPLDKVLSKYFFNQIFPHDFFLPVKLRLARCYIINPPQNQPAKLQKIKRALQSKARRFLL